MSTHGLYDPAFEHDSCGVGFVCDIQGRRSRTIVSQGLEVLRRLSHRGATGADPKTGDGAGILMQMPHRFFEKVSADAGFSLPAVGEYGTGLVFLPQKKEERDTCKRALESAVNAEGLSIIGWRTVSVNGKEIGKTAQASQPVIEQPFIARRKAMTDTLSFERSLYLVRKMAENTVRASSIEQKKFFYITNLSCRTFSYKGLLMPDQMEKFFPELSDPSIESAIAIVHSRYSTNTFPTWDLAQPFRYLAHNGEINTLQGSVNWMRSREQVIQSPLFGDRIKHLSPLIVPGGSDSAALDNAFELLLLSGRSLAHAMMMLVPPAWENNKLIDKKLKDFYLYHALLMGPWDGPAALAFSDGTEVGALLDRNGLRPARYIQTKSGMVVMASEVGVLDIPPEDIAVSGRIEPGKIFLVDTAKGRIIDDAEVKDTVASQKPYSEWTANTILFSDIPPAAKTPAAIDNAVTQFKAFGYTREDMRIIMKPMAENAEEPVGSMGNDTPPAVLSNMPHHIYTYFKQLFAQVTNPPIDPIREEIVMSMKSYLGPQGNILEESPEHAKRLVLENPILTDEEMLRLETLASRGFSTRRIPIVFDAKKNDLKAALDRVCAEAEQAVRDGISFIILSDRSVNADNAPIPALIAVGAVHHHLVKVSLRVKTDLILETGEPREVHHFALLFSYGADCVNPYLAYEAVRHAVKDFAVPIDDAKAVYNYIKAIKKGLFKVFSKMGISTLQGYRGAQIFEALGVGPEVIERCFAGTVSRIGGITFDTIAEETLMRHTTAYGIAKKTVSGGLYQWRRDGEYHLWNPETIAAIQEATRTGNYARYKEFAALINDQSKNAGTLRGMFMFKKTKAIALSDVEPAKNITRRFVTGAMSFGSISRGAHESIAIAMNRIGGMSNTGEGGEDPARFTKLPNGDSRRSAIKQVASGRFGVTTNYLINADELQIKIAQGAKPGEGGQLPGHKVNAVIARTRYTTEGVTLISPPPHHDIYSIEDLAQLIFDLKNVNPSARISVKLVSEIGVGTIAAGVAKGHADMILIAGGDGGTGASPLSSIKHAGLPWELGLAETHQTLVMNDLRSRVRLQTDGQIRTGRDLVIAAMLGAEEYGFATSALIVLGCVMLRHCHLNNCSVGVATQDELLERRFRGKVDHLVNFFTYIAENAREEMAALGVKSIDELIGRSDLLETNTAILPWKAKGIDFSRIFYRPDVPKNVAVRRTIMQDHGIENVLDRTLIEKAASALNEQKAVSIELPIRNVNRTTGAMLSGEVCKRVGEEGLPDDTIHARFTGIAGQSFGAFLTNGITFELEGMANDYVGKGLFGGRIIIYPPKQASYDSAKNIIIGNTTFYGAIRGEAYIRGVAGERFCIRNSGVYAVVEGVGDHGLEYMTGGRVVILGRTGRNFAAGMSGGIGYVYDIDGDFRDKCNMDMVELSGLNDYDTTLVRSLIHNHFRYTRSPAARTALDDFSAAEKRFIKVMPLEYKRILETKDVNKQMRLAGAYDG
ncbi:MAG: glutamate synthase large subunit [Spirochaetota bacterium]